MYSLFFCFQLPIDPLVEHLLRIDPPMRASGHDSNKCETEMHLMTLLMRLADTELVDVINWAKSIPGNKGFNTFSAINQ